MGRVRGRGHLLQGLLLSELQDILLSNRGQELLDLSIIRVDARVLQSYVVRKWS